MVKLNKDVYGKPYFPAPWQCEICCEEYRVEEAAKDCEENHKNKLTPAEWRIKKARFIQEWNKHFRKGTFWCLHEWSPLGNDPGSPPRRLIASVKYPYGNVIYKLDVEDIKWHVGDKASLIQCLKCGKVGLDGYASGPFA